MTPAERVLVIEDCHYWMNRILTRHADNPHTYGIVGGWLSFDAKTSEYFKSQNNHERYDLNGMLDLLFKTIEELNDK